jgi:glycerol-3-phosphate dehydrogenase
MAFAEEVDFILNESARYLSKAPSRADVRSVWVGLRPLVKPQKTTSGNTKGISREHTILISESGLVTVTGGKWTTYRAMAEDVLQQCLDSGLITKSDKLPMTADCPLVGAPRLDESYSGIPLTHQQGPHSYGTEQSLLSTLPGCELWLCEGLSEAMVRFAVRYEYARTVEDVLARRSRLLFLDAALALELSDKVATILISEKIQNPQLEAFKTLAQSYMLPTLR